jgi:uncharacterized protein (TIGR02099 family)
VTAAASSPRQSSPLRLLRRALRIAGWTLIALWSVLLLAWLTLHWGILNHIDEWRPQIEARVSRALGASVQIGRIEVRSGGWVPALELRDVVVRDAGQREALRLPRVLAALSPRSLLALEPRLEQLLIDGAALEVRRDAAGGLHVGGIDLGQGAASQDRAAADWFLRQHEFVVRGGTLTWIDEQRPGAPPLALSDVAIAIRNGLLHHDLRLDATPPPEWGARFSVRGQFTQPLLAAASDWQRWSGELQLELPRADVRELRRHAELPFELSQGEGALRAWLDLKNGAPRELTLDLALRDVALRLAKNVEPMAFERIEGRITAARTKDGVALAAQRFGFVSGDGLAWPRGDVRVAWRQRESAAGASVPAPISGGEASADRLDLALMAAIAARVPMGDALRKLLAETAPRGIVEGLAARWDGPLDAPAHYEVKARLRGLSVAAHASSEPRGIGRPGLRNADIELAANEKGGNAALRLAGGALELPGVMEAALLPLDRFSAQLGWTITPAKDAQAPPALQVRLANAAFGNADAQGELNATWRSGPGAGSARGGRYPGLLELDGRIARGVAARTARYLPLGIPEGVRRYVARAVTAGTITGASFRIKGDLWDFPFANPARSGEFRIAAQVEDASFAYVPSAPANGTEAAFDSPWPALTQVSGELVFDRAAMEVRNARARVGGFELTGVQGGIRNLAAHPLLALEGNGQGALAEALRFVNASPVGHWIGDALAQSSASGPADLRLALAIPLADAKQATVKGSVTLAGNDLRIRPDTPLLGAARGRIDFTQRGFAIVGASAKVLGGDASFEGGSQGDGSLRFAGQGTASAEGLRQAKELGFVARVAGALSGQASYRLDLGFVKGLPEIAVTSDLVGMALELPAPLAKSAEATLPMRYQTTLVPESLRAGQAPRDHLRFELGNLVQASYLRDLSGRDAAQVLRGGIGVQDGVPQPAQGVQANATFASLDVEAWQAVMKKMSAAPPARAASAAPAGAGAGESAGSGYLPSSIALRAQTLLVASRSLTHLVAGITQEDNVWRANLDADQLAGYVEYRAPRRAGAGLVYARLSRLALPQSEAETVDRLLDEPASSPASNAPALDIAIDDFQLRGKRLGRIEIEATNRRPPGDETPREGPRDWRLTRLALSVPEATLTATGRWARAAEADAKRRVTMDFTLDVGDSGALLERLGTPKALRGGKGRLVGQVSWLGSPFTLDYASMGGQLALAMEAGQFLKAEPGAARLLGVLSLQALPRRLLLDFRDVFQQGFAFDSVSGDVTIAQGVASTNNLRMRGVQAAVLMEGEANLQRETQDLKVVVVPEINAGTASLAYAAINPAIGLGTFLAQLFLRKPLAEAGTREFHITGSWDDPKVEKIERKPTAEERPKEQR